MCGVSSLTEDTKSKLQPKPHHREAIKVLKKHGWDVIAIGGDIITKNVNDPQPYKYWYIIPFLGSNKSHKEELATLGVKSNA